MDTISPTEHSVATMESDSTPISINLPPMEGARYGTTTPEHLKNTVAAFQGNISVVVDDIVQKVISERDRLYQEARAAERAKEAAIAAHQYIPESEQPIVITIPSEYVAQFRNELKRIELAEHASVDGTRDYMTKLILDWITYR